MPIKYIVMFGVLENDNFLAINRAYYLKRRSLPGAEECNFFFVVKREDNKAIGSPHNYVQ